MGVTVLGRKTEEIEHLLKFAAQNIRDVKSFLVIYLIPEDKGEDRAREEIEPIVRDIADDIPYEIKPFTGSAETAVETFLARREDMRMILIHVKKLDIKELLEKTENINILRKLEKGVIKIPVLFIPHR